MSGFVSDAQKKGYVYEKREVFGEDAPDYSWDSDPRFGFHVMWSRYGFPGEMREGWDVNLPHQCDSWDIAEQVSKDEARHRLALFIAEATEALKALDETKP